MKMRNIDVLLVTVAEIEARAILSLFPTSQSYHLGNQTYHDLGSIGGARVFMVQSEMGSGGQSGSMLTIQEGIAALQPSAVIMVGIAFGMNEKKQRIGDILVSKQIMDYDFQRVGTDKDGKLVIIPRGDRPSASPRMLSRFRAAVKSWNGSSEVEFGLLLSGAKLVDNQDFRDQLLKLETEAIGGEMEGGGLYAAAQRKKVDWILVKAICDWADGNKHQDKRERQQRAAENAARFTVHILEQGGFEGTEQEITETDAINNDKPKPTAEQHLAYSNQAEIRELLELSTAKGIEKYLSQTAALGIDVHQIARRITPDLKSSTSEALYSKGYWKVTITLEGIEKGSLQGGDLYEMVANASVNVHHTIHFPRCRHPYISGTADEYANLNFEGNDFQDGPPESWRMFENGVFVYHFGIDADLANPKFLEEKSLLSEKYMNLENIVATFSRIIRLASNLTAQKIQLRSVEIKIELEGLGERILYNNNPASFINRWRGYKAVTTRYRYNERFTPKDLLANANDLSVKWSSRFLKTIFPEVTISEIFLQNTLILYQ